MGKKGKGKKQQHEDQEKQEETTQVKEQEQENKKEKNDQNKPQVQLVQPRKVQYCPICTFPFELCKYGKKASDCKKFLMQIAPTKVSKYHPDGNDSNQQKEQQGNQKVQKVQHEAKQHKQQKHKKEKSVKEKYILIDVKQREKKKFTSQISGLSNFKIDGKQLAKKLSKKFACSCSALDEDKVQVQGDFFEQIKQILINDYKMKKKYILDKDEYKEKVGQEKEKKKQLKKIQDNTIPEEPEKEDKGDAEPEGPKYKTKIQNMLADISDDDDDKDK